jgi:hypothetical protein
MHYFCNSDYFNTKQLQSNLSIATTQDHGQAWLLWTGGLYIQVNYIGKTLGGRREQVVASTGNRYMQVVAGRFDCIFFFITILFWLCVLQQRGFHQDS